MIDFIDLWFPIMFALSMGFWAAQTMFTLHFLNKKVNKITKDIQLIELYLRTDLTREEKYNAQANSQIQPIGIDWNSYSGLCK